MSLSHLVRRIMAKKKKQKANEPKPIGAHVKKALDELKRRVKKPNK